MPPCLTLSIKRYESRIKWSNQGKGVAPSPTRRCSSYWKGSLLVALDYGRQLFTYSYTIIGYRSAQFTRRILHLHVYGSLQFFTRVLNLQGRAYILSFTDRLFRCITTLPLSLQWLAVSWIFRKIQHSCLVFFFASQPPVYLV